MLKSINQRYLIFGIVILLFFVPKLTGEFSIIYIINIVVLFAYYTTINQPIYRPDSYFTKQRLAWSVFLYSTFFVIINKLVSFYFTDNFFVFSENDAFNYHRGAIEMGSKSFFEGIDYVLNTYEYEDLGAFLLISLLYNIVESNLIVNTFYIFVGIITAISIFSICKNFISKKYSFLCALSYSISSFVIWFHSSGLKESFMVMLIILFYDHYYRFARLKKAKNAFFAILFLSLILLFRPAISFFCIISIAVSILLNRKKGLLLYSILIVGAIAIGVAYSYISSIMDRYLLGGPEEMLAIKEASGMVKEGSVSFTYTVNIIASSLGPLPTILPNTKQVLSIFSIGLIYRVFISTAFWLGVIYCIKNKTALIYPVLVFVLLEMVSLTFILEALELRKSLPHIPFVFITAFWFLDNYDSKIIEKKRYLIKTVWNVSSVLFLCVILYWNYR